MSQGDQPGMELLCLSEVAGVGFQDQLIGAVNQHYHSNFLTRTLVHFPSLCSTHGRTVSPCPSLLTARVVGAPEMSSQSFYSHFPLFSTALWDLANSRPVHFLMLSSYLFFCLLCFLPKFSVPCKMVLARPDGQAVGRSFGPSREGIRRSRPP